MLCYVLRVPLLKGILSISPINAGFETSAELLLNLIVRAWKNVCIKVILYSVVYLYTTLMYMGVPRKVILPLSGMMAIRFYVLIFHFPDDSSRIMAI